MKTRRIAMLACVLLFIAGGCREKPAEEEKIRITIEKPSEKASEKSAPAPAVQDTGKAEVKKPAAGELPAKKSVPEQKEENAATPRPMSRMKEAGSAHVGEEPAGERLAFRKIAEFLNRDTRSKEQIRHFWSKLRGRTLMLEGEVVRIQPGRGGFKILVNNSAASSPQGYNIVLVGRGQEERLQSLSPGTPVRFRGTVIDFEAGGKGFGPILILRNSQIM